MHHYAMNENLVLEIEFRLNASQANTLLTELHSQLPRPSDRIGSADKAGVDLPLPLPLPDC